MAAFLLITGSCAPRVQSPAAGPSITTDGDRLAVHGGEIWYRVVGGGPGLPVLLLHGGPGVSSYHMKPLEALGDERLVVRYDQLGSGRSDASGKPGRSTTWRPTGPRRSSSTAVMGCVVPSHPRTFLRQVDDRR
jgi:pimeloyl-ACP methyl ester carboxylesterase